MKDIDLVIAVRAALVAWYASRSLVCEVRGAYQPTAQGTPSGPYLAFFQVGPERRIGWPAKNEVYNTETETFDRTESIQMETTFQFSAGAPQTPGNLVQLSPRDVLKSAARGLQSDDVAATLAAAGVGVLRIRDIRNGVVSDDKMQHAPEPSFDVVFTHRDTETFTTPVVDSFEITTHRI